METWRAIRGFEGRYEVSDQGRVRSLQRKGEVRPEPLILKDQPVGKGYRGVRLFDGERFHNVYIHRLVLAAFRGDPPAEGMQGAHLDGSRDNNRLANLIWATVAENHAHKRIHGTLLLGEACAGAKLTAATVAWLRREWRADDPARNTAALAQRIGLTASHVGQVISGQKWAHVDEPARRRSLSRPGELNGRAKLTPDDVRAIREECRRIPAREKGARAALAERFGIARCYLDAIVRRRSWASLPDAPAAPPNLIQKAA